MEDRLDYLDWLRPKRGNVLDLINAAYGIRPRPLATAPTADLLLARFKSMLPDRRQALCRAVRGDTSLPRFEVFGNFRVKSDGGQPTIEGIASSTRQDLDGDVMQESALRDLLALRGSTAFLNHSYRWPEDALGQITRTALAKSGAVTTLRVTVNVAQDNPRAMQSYKMIKGGTRAGFSVGVIVLQSSTIDLPNGRRGLSIERLLPLELSLAGIPSCQDAWVTSAKTALKALKGVRA